MTGGYILKRVDVLPIDAANRVADQIALQMRSEAPPSNIAAFQPRGRRPAPLAALAVESSGGMVVVRRRDQIFCRSNTRAR